MSALPPKADLCGALAYVCFVPKADIRETTCIKQKNRLAAVSPKFTPIFLIDQATAADFRSYANLVDLMRRGRWRTAGGWRARAWR